MVSVLVVALVTMNLGGGCYEVLLVLVMWSYFCNGVGVDGDINDSVGDYGSRWWL